MGRKKEKEGLIFQSTFIKYLSKLVYSDEHYIEKHYNDSVDFFEQVLKKELTEKDRKIIEKYFSGFKSKHKLRVKFWKNTIEE